MNDGRGALGGALFRVRVRGDEERLALGDPSGGPQWLLPADRSMDRWLGQTDVDPGTAWARLIDGVREAVPDAAVVLAPVQGQPVWAAGVTYERSRDARAEESREDATVYGRIYRAQRPELFFKAEGWRAQGPDAPIGVRRDSTWDVPEPELALVIDRAMRIVGLTIGNDVSSRSIEGDNPLYLPQAKVYDHACALGPAIVPFNTVDLPLSISMTIHRGDAVAFTGSVSTAALRRRFDELVDHLGRALRFPVGAVLMTGTGIVPPTSFTLQPGDDVVITIDGLGTLRNPVIDVGTEPDTTASTLPEPVGV